MGFNLTDAELNMITGMLAVQSAVNTELASLNLFANSGRDRNII